MLEDKIDKIKLKRIKFEISLVGFGNFGNKPLVYTDKKRLQQVILNLLSNAIKFTDRARFEVREGSVQIQAINLSNCQIKILIRDSGIGIKKEDQSKLFKMLENVWVDQGLTNQIQYEGNRPWTGLDWSGDQQDDHPKVQWLDIL